MILSSYNSQHGIRFLLEIEGDTLMRITSDFKEEPNHSYSPEIVIPEGIAVIADDICSTLSPHITFSDISLPKSLKHIGNRAFHNRINELRKLGLPAGLLTIGDEAFSREKPWWSTISVSSLTIPNKVKTIGKKAFYRWSSVKKLKLGSSISEIGDGAFAYCFNILDWEGPQFKGKCLLIDGCLKAVFGESEILRIPEEVTAIGSLAFSSSYIYRSPSVFSSETMRGAEKIILHDKITQIGDMAFSGSRCRILDIPSSVSRIGINPISETLCTKLSGHLTQSESYIVDGTTLKGVARIPLTTPIPENITKIGEYAFYGNPSENIIVPEGVKEIGDHAFNWCYNLKSLILPSKVERIGKFAFSKCQKLEQLTIPESVRFIGESAFYWMSNCKAIKFESLIPPFIEASTEDGYYNTITGLVIHVPKDSVELYRRELPYFTIE